MRSVRAIMIAPACTFPGVSCNKYALGLAQANGWRAKGMAMRQKVRIRLGRFSLACSCLLHYCPQIPNEETDAVTPKQESATLRGVMDKNPGAG